MRLTSTLGFGVLVLAFGSIAFACSSSDGGGTTTPPADDAGPEAAVPTGTLSVLVVATTFDGAVRSDPPAPNVAVSIDKPGGDHEELVTDADGKITFTGIDWTKGGASVAAATTPGHWAYGVTDVQPTNFKGLPNGPNEGKAEVVLYLFEIEPASVPLSINIANKVAAGNHVDISATTSTGVVEVTGAKAQIPLATGKAAKVVAWELAVVAGGNTREINATPVKWVALDVPAPSAPTTVDLDLATATVLTPVTTHSHVVIPGGESGPLAGSRLTMGVRSSDAVYVNFFGGVHQSTLTADKGAFDATVQTVMIDGIQPLTTYDLALADGSTSTITRFAYPAEGETIDGFINPVPLTISKQAYKDPIDLTGAAPDTATRTYVVSNAGDVLFITDTPPGVTAIHMPTLPAADQATFKKTAATGQLISLAGNDPVHFYYTKTAVSRSFDLTP